MADAAHSPAYRQALLDYGAIILSFVGALHWGFAMTAAGLPQRTRQSLWLWSVVPALLGWIALQTATGPAVAILWTGFVAQYVQDLRIHGAAGLPGWYLPLRGRLTLVACLSLGLALLSDR